MKNCDAFFLQASRTSLDETAGFVRRAKQAAREQGRDIGCYTVGVVTCKPTRKAAEEYFHHCIVERADWSAVDGILALKDISPQTVPMAEYLLKRSQYAQGMGGLPIVGDPDHVAAQLADLGKAGLTGIAISLVNYLDELPYFCAEVIGRLERLGLREKVRLNPPPRMRGRGPSVARGASEGWWRGRLTAHRCRCRMVVESALPPPSCCAGFPLPAFAGQDDSYLRLTIAVPRFLL